MQPTRQTIEGASTTERHLLCQSKKHEPLQDPKRQSRTITRMSVGVVGSRRVIKGRRCVETWGRSCAWPGTSRGRWRGSCSWRPGRPPGRTWCAAAAAVRSPSHAAWPGGPPRCLWSHPPPPPACRHKGGDIEGGSLNLASLWSLPPACRQHKGEGHWRWVTQPSKSVISPTSSTSLQTNTKGGGGTLKVGHST